MRLIDADAFKEYICNALEQTRRCYPDGGRWAEAITEQFCLDIDEQPTVTPESHWIPVTERLPEKLDYYLVSGNNSVWLARYESGRFLGVLSGHALDTVIAWMPLPEPYKGVSDGRF